MSRSHIWVWIILSSVILLFTCLAALLCCAIYFVRMHILKTVYMIHCRSYTSVRQVYQHGDYWVMENFAFSENAFARCDKITFAMEGTYLDVYKLKEFFFVPNYKEIISFAVYVPDREHYEKTLAAIDYAQNRLHNNNETWIYFHLYFRIGQMPLPQRQSSNFTLENSTQSQWFHFNTVAQQQHVKIVGKNIAVEAAATKYHIQSDISAFPSQKFAYDWVLESAFTPTDKLLQDYRVVWRVPTILVSNLQENQHYARVSILEFDQNITERPNLINSRFAPFDKIDFLKENYAGSDKMIDKHKYPFDENLKQLLAHKSFFISNAQMPILEERLGLTMELSEQLLIIQLALQNYTFLPLYRVFFLYDIGNVTNYERSFKVDNMSRAILNEYSVMYSNDKCLLDVLCQRKNKIQN